MTSYSEYIDIILLVVLLLDLVAFLGLFVCCFASIRKRTKELCSCNLENKKLHNLLKRKEKELSFIKTGRGSALGHFFEHKNLKTPKIKFNKTNKNSRIMNKKEVNIEFLSYHFLIANQLHPLHPGFSQTEIQDCVFLYLGVSIEETARKLKLPIAAIRTRRCKVRSKILKSNSSNLKSYVKAVVLN